MLKKIAIMTAVLVLSACGDDNKLIGKWEGEMPKQMGFMAGMMPKDANIIEFTRSSMKSGNTETEIDSYTVEEKRTGVVIAQGNQKATQWFDFIDADTMSMDLGMGMKMTYHRVK